MADLESLLDLLLQDEPEAEDTETSEEQENSGINLGELFALMDTYKEVVGEIKNDERAQLIKAIKPFLSDARQSKADNCLKFLSITRLMEHKDEFSKIGGKFLPV